MKNRGRIVLVGGLGTVGKILRNGLAGSYDVLTCDIRRPARRYSGDFRRVDARRIADLKRSIPDGTRAIVHLVGLPRQDALVEPKVFRKMLATYCLSGYNTLVAASHLGVRTVVLASSNHVTGLDETRGRSLLGRRIRTGDYPRPDDVYGGMKLALESWGRLVAGRCRTRVICLRIGTVVEDECAEVATNDRSRRTLLSHTDCVNVFKAAIETHVRFGIFYAVSDNRGRPWSIADTRTRLAYRPSENSDAVLRRCRNPSS